MAGLRKSHSGVMCPITVSPLHPSNPHGKRDTLVTNVFQENGAILFPHQEQAPLGSVLEGMARIEDQKATGDTPPDFVCIENCPEAGKIIDHIGLSNGELPEFMRMLQEVAKPRYSEEGDGYSVRNWWVQVLPQPQLPTGGS